MCATPLHLNRAIILIIIIIASSRFIILLSTGGALAHHHHLEVAAGEVVHDARAVVAAEREEHAQPVDRDRAHDLDSCCIQRRQEYTNRCTKTTVIYRQMTVVSTLL